MKKITKNTNKQPIVSLCLPTNGITEWVFPVLDSIYTQGVNDDLFEVIVTNNGDNDEFHKLMIDFKKKHNNCIYKKTDAYQFMNQLEVLKLAKGKYFKYINHRQTLSKGSLNKMINIIKDNEKDKPVIFFSNGVLKENEYILNSFDDFIKHLGRFISWNTGAGIWMEDYDSILNDTHVDQISPHSSILFSKRNKDKYIIENYKFCIEENVDETKKGNYDIFKCFAIEEPGIVLRLYTDGDISIDTLKVVLDDYKIMCGELYYEYIIKKTPCSYDLSGFDNSMNVFFSKKEVLFIAHKINLRKKIKGY